MPKKAIIDPLGDLWTVDGMRFSVHREPERWLLWLGLGQPFRFQGLHADGYAVNLYSVRPKMIKGHRFWYAERKHNGRTCTVYLGKDDAVTIERLRWAIARVRQGLQRAQYLVESAVEPSADTYDEERERAVEA